MPDITLPIFLTSGIIMLVSLIGVVTFWKGFERWVEENLSKLVSFSAGVFIVVAFSLAYESFEHFSSFIPWIAAIAGGAFILWIVSFLLPESHHHHTSHECPANECPDPRNILLSDGVHNITDGFILVASFAAGSTFGLTAAIGILVHEIIQEISEFFVLREGGYSAKRALILNFLVSATILIGVAIGFIFLSHIDKLEGILLGIASGAFLYTVTRDLIPHSVRASRKQQSFLPYLSATLLGSALMIVAGLFIGH